MIDHEVAALLKRAEMATTGDAAFVAAMMSSLGAAMKSEDRGQVSAGALVSTEQALDLVAAARPGWEVALHGQARRTDGRWTCTLRESGARDDDERIGTARAPAPALALVAALLATLAKARRDS